MNAKDLVHAYRKAIVDPIDIKKRQKEKLQIITLFLIGILINAITLFFVSQSVLGVSLGLFLQFIMFSIMPLLDSSDALKMKQKLIKAKYVGTLSEIFDMKCPYTNEVLHSHHLKIKKHVSKHSGIKGSLILELETTINELKEIKLTGKETKIYQDLYDLHQGKENQRDLVTEKEDKAKVTYFALRIMYNDLKHKFSTSVYLTFGILAFPITFVLVEKLIRFYLVDSLEPFDQNILFLIKANFVLYFGILMVYLIFLLRLNRISKKSLYEIFDIQDALTKEILLKQFKKISLHASVYQGYQNKFINKLKKQISKEKENRINVQEQLEREKILIASGTKLGNLISDVNDLA